VPIATTAPNDLWTADFKSQFRTGNVPWTEAVEPTLERSLGTGGFPEGVQIRNIGECGANQLTGPFASRRDSAFRRSCWDLTLGSASRVVRSASPFERGPELLQGLQPCSKSMCRVPVLLELRYRLSRTQSLVSELSQ